MIYEGANHGVGDSPSTDNGEDKNVLLSDWLVDRIAGKPFRSERVWVDLAGRAIATGFDE